MKMYRVVSQTKIGNTMYICDILKHKLCACYRKQSSACAYGLHKVL